ncbi:MAG: gamma-glutamyltransferase [Methyloligellaceae bacterium]
MRSFSHPGRSTVYASNAMCATSHPLASQAAVDIMKEGGNAVDAAIAASAVLAVVEPHMTGIGGDCFALFWKPGAKVMGLSGMGRAAAAATPEWYAEKNMVTVEPTSAHAVTVPGAIDGWCRLVEDHGSLPMSRIMETAIILANEGFPVSPRTAHDWVDYEYKLGLYESTRACYLKDGKAPKVGDVMRFPELGKSLSMIAEGGRDAFYTGELASDMVDTLQALGGLQTMEDFAQQSSTYVTPITAGFKGMDIYEMPPSNHGMTAIMMLKMLERIDDRGSEAVSAKRYHVMMEAARMAYGARDEYLADPDFMDIPIEHLISDAVADELARRIDPDRRTPDLGNFPQPASNDTVYLTVVDKNGMVVSFINSIYHSFGSGITAPKSGILLHSRGYGFRFMPGHVNSIAPRKRPMHTLIPGMALKDGVPVASFGVMGADFQPTGHVHVLTNMYDYGMDPQEALDSPRVFFEGETLAIEQGVPENVVKDLISMGHEVKIVPEPWGGGQIITIDRKRNILIGGSDPRKDGVALGY